MVNKWSPNGHQVIIHFHEFSSDFIHFHALSSMFIHYINFTHSHPLSSIFIHFIHFHPLLSPFIRFHPLSSTSYMFTQFYPFSSTFIDFHPLSSTFIHFHPLSSTFTHFHPFSSTDNYCGHTGPHLRDPVPMGTFFSFWVPISVPRSPFSLIRAKERMKSLYSHYLMLTIWLVVITQLALMNPMPVCQFWKRTISPPIKGFISSN